MDINQKTYNTSSLASIVGISSRSVWTMCENGLIKPIIGGRIDSRILTRSHVKGGVGGGRLFERAEILKAAYIVGLVLDAYERYNPVELRSYGEDIVTFSPHSVTEGQIFYVFLGLLHGSKAQLLTERMQVYPKDMKIMKIFNDALARMQNIE